VSQRSRCAGASRRAELRRARGLGLDRIVDYSGWTADLTDNHETIRDGNGNVVQQLTFNADGTVSTDTGTAVFNFNFVDARLSYAPNGHTILTDAGGTAHDVTGATRLFFNDGHIDEADGSPLVDDLYYDAQYHDVYSAGLDPDAHYAGNGWHEGRNPNAFLTPIIISRTIPTSPPPASIRSIITILTAGTKAAIPRPSSRPAAICVSMATSPPPTWIL
jgi:hypothetical protein